MPTPLYEADDLHDAAADAIRYLSDRLNRRGLEFTPETYGPLREVLAAALQMAWVEWVEG